MKRDVQIAVRVRSELRDALRKLATADKRTLSAYIEIILEEHLAAKKAKR